MALHRGEVAGRLGGQSGRRDERDRQGEARAYRVMRVLMGKALNRPLTVGTGVGAGNMDDVNTLRETIRAIVSISTLSRHCERSAAIQGVLVRLWIAALRSQ
ncbi:hypothetical protein MOP88_06070 [Sphingomonas sp. WKB10]|nr:hypothetical protein [Sphingomonas sp. WKB10]